MDTFEDVAARLEQLERTHFARLKAEFPWPGAMRSCITGAVQFGVVDAYGRASATPLPVVCAVGVNYTQETADDAASGLTRYCVREGRPSVIDSTGSRHAVAHVLAAYNRNAAAWIDPPALTPASPVGAYGSPGATAAAGLTSSVAADLNGAFILIMTNVCPSSPLRSGTRCPRLRSLAFRQPARLGVGRTFIKTVADCFGRAPCVPALRFKRCPQLGVDLGRATLH